MTNKEYGEKKLKRKMMSIIRKKRQKGEWKNVSLPAKIEKEMEAEGVMYR